MKRGNIHFFFANKFLYLLIMIVKRLENSIIGFINKFTILLCNI